MDDALQWILNFGLYIKFENNTCWNLYFETRVLVAVEIRFEIKYLVDISHSRLRYVQPCLYQKHRFEYFKKIKEKLISSLQKDHVNSKKNQDVSHESQ